MATTVYDRPTTDRVTGDRPSNNGGSGNIRPTGGDMRRVGRFSPPPSITAVWVGIAAIGMMFAAFTSAMVIRQGAAMDWRHIPLPPILYLNTLVLLASSVTLELARRGESASAKSERGPVADQGFSSRWLYATLALGGLFVVGQYAAWRTLSGEGLYLATNPSSSFFYVLTAAHALHVLGGLAGLIYVLQKMRKAVLQPSTLDAASRYWHFMDVLWLYLLWVLWMKL